MDEDLGGDLADLQGHNAYYEDRGICPVCLFKYNKDNECRCDDEEEW